MSARIPTITAHKQMELVTRGFDIKHEAIERMGRIGEPGDQFTVDFQMKGRTFRFFIGFRGEKILFMDLVPVFLVSQEDPNVRRRSSDISARNIMDAFFNEIGFGVNRAGRTWVDVYRIKQEVAA